MKNEEKVESVEPDYLKKATTSIIDVKEEKEEEARSEELIAKVRRITLRGIIDGK